MYFRETHTDTHTQTHTHTYIYTHTHTHTHTHIASTPMASGDRNAALLLAVICTGIRLAGPWLLFADTSTSYRLSLSLEIRNTFPSYLQIYSSCNTRKSSSYRAMSWRHQSSGGCTTPVSSVSGLQSCKVPSNLSVRRMKN